MMGMMRVNVFEPLARLQEEPSTTSFSCVLGWRVANYHSIRCEGITVAMYGGLAKIAFKSVKLPEKR